MKYNLRAANSRRPAAEDAIMPTRDHTTLLASHQLRLGLVDECLPVWVTSTEETSYFESWEVTRAALIARMASTLRHLGYLAPSYSRLDGLALARSLVDHVITFAWISADPKERLPAFLRSSFKDLLAKDKRFHGRARATARKRGAGPSERVHPRGHPGDARTPAALVRGRRPLARASPVLAARAYAHRRLPALVQRIYDHYAAYNHPTTLGLQVFVHLAGSPVVATVDGQPERSLDEDLRPYWIAVFAFAEALIRVQPVLSPSAPSIPAAGPRDDRNDAPA